MILVVGSLQLWWRVILVVGVISVMVGSDIVWVTSVMVGSDIGCGSHFSYGGE